MNATTRFIEDSVKGGWRANDPLKEELFNMLGYATFLEVDLWQAVGKTRGWDTKDSMDTIGNLTGWYRVMWHRFIDHLADGKTIDQALSALEE